MFTGPVLKLRRRNTIFIYVHLFYSFKKVEVNGNAVARNFKGGGAQKWGKESEGCLKPPAGSGQALLEGLGEGCVSIVRRLDSPILLHNMGKKIKKLNTIGLAYVVWITLYRFLNDNLKEYKTNLEISCTSDSCCL